MEETAKLRKEIEDIKASIKQLAIAVSDLTEVLGLFYEEKYGPKPMNRLELFNLEAFS